MDLTTFVEWANIAIRWIHVFAGILWIGQTYFFAWLDRQLNASPQEDGGAKSASSVWMVHSGGFYIVNRQTSPSLLPGTLHWFKWEAAITWISGIALLILVYYYGGLLVEWGDTTVSEGTALVIGIGVLIGAWPVYDFLWRSPLGKNQIAGTAVSYLLIVAVSYGLTLVLSPRAAYMHVGAMLGTLMTVNVWEKILPAQRRMVAALEKGKSPDLTLGEQAKTRSKHNTFMVMPVVFIMISNHFPTATYGHDYNWLVPSILVLVGWGAAAILRRA